jgi:hypothetical protein
MSSFGCLGSITFLAQSSVPPDVLLLEGLSAYNLTRWLSRRSADFLDFVTNHETVVPGLLLTCLAKTAFV